MDILKKHMEMINESANSSYGLEEKMSDVPVELRKKANLAKTTMDNIWKRMMNLEAAVRKEDDSEKAKSLADMLNQVKKDHVKQEKEYKKLKSQIAKIAKK
jgi:hypothetical protein